MNYPIWEITTIGGGSLIALISILHVYIAHLAVGGGIFLWLTDRKGFREGNPAIHRYVKTHTWFFLLLTMVFGGVSGVGIWFIIALVHPAATSKLIHAFVFGWAIEWVFFLGEIVALLIYHYKFDRLEQKSRLTIAFLYALFAWLSLFIINGILSFMLTPGKWLVTGNFWHGFLNPTFFPSLIFRTFVATMIAGLFGYITTVFQKETDLRAILLKYCSRWLLLSLVGMIAGGVWYYFSAPLEIRETAFGLNPQTSPFVMLMIVTTVLVFSGGLYFSLKTNSGVQKILSFGLVFIGLCWMGGFEYVREIARKPFVISQFMYSTSLMKQDIPRLNADGILANAKWTAIKEITPENRIEAGRELFNIQCLSCHTVNGIRNDIMERTGMFPLQGLMSSLTGQGKILNYMPMFVGAVAEKEALAAYIVSGLHRKGDGAEKEVHVNRGSNATEIPAFHPDEDKFLLLVWNDLGMHCISDCDRWFVILPPANTLEAQLFARGEVPQLVTESVEITYAVEPGFENPADALEFWKYAPANFGVTLENNIGLAGLGLSGKFTYNEERSAFVAEKIPVAPYRADGSYNPYPVFTVEARYSTTGDLVASTKVVAPASTEMGCKKCHGGDWRVNGLAGVSDETAANILRAHDRISGTDLYQQAQRGKPQLCQSCHADPALAAPGKPELRNFSAAMHGWHANYISESDGTACALCHPAFKLGATRCQRDLHSEFGLDCVSCHGTIQEHAISLLLHEKDKKGTSELLNHLHPTRVASRDEVNPRMPWLNEPDCLTCHENFEQPGEGSSGFNVWNEDPAELYRMRFDNAGIRCEACHGATHALYPAKNLYGTYRDVIQPMQYSGRPYPIGANQNCDVCHIKKMEDPIHHENMYRMMRNRFFVD
ncbi:MAG: cytochrome C [Candidatus Zhuqueibacterota bacterium]